MMIPPWLHALAWACLIVAGMCAFWILGDILAGHRQNMWIMNVVWPVTALYAGPLAVWGYYKYGRLSTRQAVQNAKAHGREPPGKKKPFPAMIGLAATHCGAGCTLGDIIAESLVAAVGLKLWGNELFADFFVDFGFAYVLGIAFQYFTIVPMRGLSFWPGLWAAIRADTLSLTAWQVGMYGWMAIVYFLLFGHLARAGVDFWFMMQIGMLCGFLTAYPVNWWLVKQGYKEKM